MANAICIAEDRQSCEVGVELLVRSIVATCPWATVYVFVPNATKEFSSWLSQTSQVIHETERLPGASGWNVKPHALLHLIDLGFEEVIWLDSDILVVRDLRDCLGTVEGDCFVASEEALWGAHSDKGAFRASAWNLEVGRVLPFCLNSAVLRVTKQHRPLLADWRKMLESDRYRETQSKKWKDRPRHLAGDQDALTALLCSREYANVELKILVRGRDIIQYFGLRGYTTWERTLNILCGPPALIHTQGTKLWTEEWHQAYIEGERDARLRPYIEAIYKDLSPYTIQAMSLKPTKAEWMKAHFHFSAFLRRLGFGYFPLVGFPIAAAVDLAAILLSLRGGTRDP
jgi:hypothetical protein